MFQRFSYRIPYLFAVVSAFSSYGFLYVKKSVIADDKHIHELQSQSQSQSQPQTQSKSKSQLPNNITISDLVNSNTTSLQSSESTWPLSKYHKRSGLTTKQLKEKYEKAIQESRELIKGEKQVQGFPGCTIAVIKEGRLIWEEGFGYADVENFVEMKPNAVMRIASISKPVTCTGIAYLLQKGKLSLNDTVQKYLPDFPEQPYITGYDENGKPILSQEKYKITIGDLVHHQSGIRHYNDDKEFYQSQHYDTAKDALEIFKNDPLLFIPGTNYTYSTYGFTLLSAIIEEITHKSFIDFMDDVVFKPLNMKSTSGDFASTIIHHRARQYVRKVERKRNRKHYVRFNDTHTLLNAPYVDNSNKVAGGGIVSTASDIAILAYHTIIGDYFNDDVKKLMLTPARLADGSLTTYGTIGWKVKYNEKNELIVVAHSGGACGGTSHVLVLPQEDIVICILINMRAQPKVTYEIAQFFRAIDDNEHMEHVARRSVPVV